MEEKKSTTEKYDTKKVVKMIVFGGAITIFIMTMIFAFDDFESIWEVIKTTDYKYMLLAIMLLLVYLLLYPVTTCILTKTKKCDISNTNTYLIGFTEHFFNGITPFATGGQPFQVYAYKRLGVKLADSTGILMMNFIIFMMVTNLYALISLFYYPLLSENIANLNSMVIIGFGINFFVLLFIISVATTKRVREWLEKAMLWLCRFKWLNKLIAPNIDKFNDYCYGAQAAFKELWHHKKSFVLCFIIKFITMGVYYSITYYILKALHIDVTPDKLPFIIFSTAFAITMCVFIPTPGGSGGIEFAFKSIFQAIAIGITESVAMGGMLLWRLLSYFLAMLISFFAYIILENVTLKREKEIKSMLPKMAKTVTNVKNKITTNKPKLQQDNITQEEDENAVQREILPANSENASEICVESNKNSKIDNVESFAINSEISNKENNNLDIEAVKVENDSLDIKENSVDLQNEEK